MRVPGVGIKSFSAAITSTTKVPGEFEDLPFAPLGGLKSPRVAPAMVHYLLMQIGVLLVSNIWNLPAPAKA